ncbi:methyltransferase domain-containing protein [Streptomyces sp. PKU-MA01144]|uniref:methyltransferase domain-containing protein n=1 Tax=Streptomyces sp. PKU-MA01144 TaxID=2729138 RepID=UPI001480FFD4|nr:methyltransferase domain-containing protein [Streptomyces sp. PKU-MA01144]NNJ06893.1 methyltransferase domain-containing protein [Streptomyces sp. PKU-MA01144]
MTTIDWDAAAGTFDEEPDHGLRDPGVRRAWAERMRHWLPPAPSDVLDLGCGTGSLALLAAEQGHRVTAVDLSPRMADAARRKLAGTAAEVLTGPAERPPVGDRRFDAVLVRHVLWALPDPEAALAHWASLLRPGGRLVLVEGVWDGSGLPASRLIGALGPLSRRIDHERLSDVPGLWGRPVHDERYALVARTGPVRYDETAEETTHKTTDNTTDETTDKTTDETTGDPSDMTTGGITGEVVGAAPVRHREVVDVHLVLRRGDDVLLARRSGTGYADGLWHGPSGHVEDGEDVRAAMVREAYEEIGVAFAPEDLRVALVMQHRGPGDPPRTGWFFEAVHGKGGEPYNREPHKCSELAWHPLAALPDDMVAYCRAAFEAYRRGERFVLHWHEDDDPVGHDPDLPDRAVPLPMTGVSPAGW